MWTILSKIKEPKNVNQGTQETMHCSALGVEMSCTMSLRFPVMMLVASCMCMATERVTKVPVVSCVSNSTSQMH